MDASAAPRRALVVDDEEVIRIALRRTLNRQGWEVDEAVDGAAALGYLVGPAAASYDVILMDLRMPEGMSGEAFYGRVAEARPDLVRRVIVLTGDSISADATDFLRRTRCPVLNKPFELAELRALVARVAEQA